MKTKQIPLSACHFKAELSTGENGENSKTIPIKMTARTNEPISTPWWGSVVHDFKGMKLHKNRLTIDYDHDTKEVLGFLNKFDSSSGDLVCSGALTPFKQDDRASEVISKMKSGVPYESSINFGGDMIIEEFGEGEEVEVNGQTHNGPITVVREWSLRGVAVCPYGMDMNTPANLMSNHTSEFVNAQIIENNRKGDLEMKTKLAEDEEEKSVDAEEKVEASETEVVETVEEEKKEEVEEDKVETQEEEPEVVDAEEELVEDEEDKELRQEFKAMVQEFGAENAALYFAEGISFSQAKEDHYQALKSENEELKAALLLSQRSNSSESMPSVVCTDDTTHAQKVKDYQLKGMSEAQAGFIAKTRINR